MTPRKTVCVHVNSRYVESNVEDLDVYDYATLSRAVQHLAAHAEDWRKMNRPDMAAPYTAFKERIKKHIGR